MDTKHLKITSTLMLSTLVCLFILLFVVSGIQYQKAKELLFASITPLLQESVEAYVNEEAEEVYYLFHNEYVPGQAKIREYETRTARYADTVITYQHRVTDIKTELFNNLQTLFVEIDRLHADSIQLVFDSLLHINNIHHTQSVIGITASFYIKKNEWSSDTTAISINYRTVLAHQGRYEDINYYAYLHYSFFTLFRLINKAPIAVLLILCVVLLTGYILLRRKTSTEQVKTEQEIPDDNCRIKYIIYNVKAKTLVVEGADPVKLAQQLHNLLLMFLIADEYRVKKEEIKNAFWKNSVSAATNMSTAVERLNKELKKITSDYIVMTDPTYEDCYRLMPIAGKSDDSIEGEETKTLFKLSTDN